MRKIPIPTNLEHWRRRSGHGWAEVTAHLGQCPRKWFTGERPTVSTFPGGWPALLERLQEMEQPEDCRLLLAETQCAFSGGRPPVWHYEPPGENEEAPSVSEQKPEEQTKPSQAPVSPVRHREPSLEERSEANIETAKDSLNRAKAANLVEKTIPALEKALDDAWREYRLAQDLQDLATDHAKGPASRLGRELERLQFLKDMEPDEDREANISRTLDCIESLESDCALCQSVVAAWVEPVLRWDAIYKGLQRIRAEIHRANGVENKANEVLRRYSVVQS